MATNTDTWVWSFVWLERLWQDVRYGCRMLAANPGFTLVAVSSLALGIGANCAAFSWADALLLRPLTVARPGEVVTVGSAMSVEGFSRVGASYRDYIDIRDRSTSFDGLVAFTGVTSGLATHAGGAAEADARPARQRQLLQRHGRRAGARPHVSRRGGSGAGPRRRRDYQSHACGNSSSVPTPPSSAGACSSAASSSRSSASRPSGSPG